jgi:Flp pilus assembly protein TadD
MAPNSALPQMKLGMLHQREGRVPEAEQGYLSAIRLDPNAAIAYNNLAWLEAERKTRLPEAEAWSKKAVTLAPQVPQFQETLAWVYHAQGQSVKAVSILQNLTSTNPQFASGFYRLGIVYAETGKNREASTYLRKALALEKNEAEAGDIRKRLASLSQTTATPKAVHP